MSRRSGPHTSHHASRQASCSAFAVSSTPVGGGWQVDSGACWYCCSEQQTIF